MLQTLATDPPLAVDSLPAPKQLGPPQLPPEGHIELDAERRRMTVDGATVELTPIELSLMQQLLEAGGRLVSFEDMVSVTHRLVVTRDEARDLLASHIRNLRRKLGSSSSRLVNVRGVGYYLVPDGD